jgi:hypothetical protein
MAQAGQMLVKLLARKVPQVLKELRQLLQDPQVSKDLQVHKV